NGTASVSGGSLVLPGVGTRANYAEVPIGRTIASSSSMTIEGWITPTLDGQTWSKTWMFGTPGPDEFTSTFVDFTPYSGITDFPPSISFRTPALGQITTRDAPNPATIPANTEYHINAVYDSAAHTMSLYINGTLADSAPWNGEMFLLGNTTQNFLGAPVLYNDPDWTGTIAELRIWKGAMSATDVANSQTAGKDSLPVIQPPAAAPVVIGSVTLSGGNIVLGNVTGLVAGQQYHLETGVTLTDFASVTGSTFTSAGPIPTVPVSGPRRFVRIVTGAAP
ncbi:MAG: LamG domain protein jellyroll fold domain protein, partial [Akkermansiaceae bacterium]|nr:LamG domain protein jellyroll fold domain protein [Akkermansiaceae bacterium]